jgi:hypothetical protein
VCLICFRFANNVPSTVVVPQLLLQCFNGFYPAAAEKKRSYLHASRERTSALSATARGPSLDDVEFSNGECYEKQHCVEWFLVLFTDPSEIEQFEMPFSKRLYGS